MTQPQRPPELAVSYRDHLRRSNVSAASIASYARTIRRVDGSEAPDPAAVVAWVRQHVTEHTPKGTFLNVRSAVMQYLSWRDYVLPDPPLLPRVRRLPAKFKDALDEAEYASWVELVASADLPDQTRAILMLLPVTALRVTEACRLRWEKYEPTWVLRQTGAIAADGTDEVGRVIALDRPAKITIVGKGNKQASISLGADAAAILADLYNSQDKPSRGWVFPSPYKEGSPLTAGAVRHHVRKLSEASDIGKSVSPHILRHTAATRLLRSGAPLTIVQTVLRHADIATTTMYLHPTDADVAAALNKLGTREG